MIIIGNYVPVFRFRLSTMHANGLKGQEVYNNQSPVVRCHLGRTNLISSTSHLEDLQIFVQYALHYDHLSQPGRLLADSLVQCQKEKCSIRLQFV